MRKDRTAVISDRKREKPAPPHRDKTVDAERAAAPSTGSRRTDKYEVETVTQEQEGGKLVSEPEP